MVEKLKKYIYLLFFFMFTVNEARAIFYEFSGNFGYDRQVYGASRQNKSISRTYSGVWAAYLFEFTALELNYSNSENKRIENESTVFNSTFDITSTQNIVETEVFGAGFRQMLAPRSAFIVPIISFGYAKQFVSGEREYTFTNVTDNSTTLVKVDDGKRKIDSAFMTFNLQFRLTKTFKITGSVRSVFKAFEWNDAKDNLKYLAGFSWIF